MKSKLSEAEQFVLLHGYIQGSLPHLKRTTDVLEGSSSSPKPNSRAGSQSPSGSRANSIERQRRSRTSVRAKRPSPGRQSGSPTSRRTSTSPPATTISRTISSSNQSAENLALSGLSWHSSSTNEVGKSGIARPKLGRNATWGSSNAGSPAKLTRSTSGADGDALKSASSHSSSYSKSSRSTMAAARGRSFRRSMSPSSDGLPASSRSPSASSDHTQRLSERLEARAQAKRGRSPTASDDSLKGDSAHGSLGTAKLAPNPKDVPPVNGTTIASASSRSPSPHRDSARNYRLSVVGLRERHSSRRLTMTSPNNSRRSLSPNNRRSISPVRASTGNNAMAATRRSVSPLRRSQSPLRRSQSPNHDDRRRSQSPCRSGNSPNHALSMRRSTSAMRNSQLQLLDDSELDKHFLTQQQKEKDTKPGEEEEEEDEVDAYFQVKWLDSNASMNHQEEEAPIEEEGDNVAEKFND